MIKYEIEEIASELMLTTSELHEVLDIYFEEAGIVLPECHKLIDNQDYGELAETMHALKGSSANLRMDKIRDLAAALEQQAKVGSKENLSFSLEIIQEEIKALQQYIDAYYRKTAQ